MSRVNGNYGRDNTEKFQDDEEPRREYDKPTKPRVFNPTLVNEENLDPSLKLGYQVGKQ